MIGQKLGKKMVVGEDLSKKVQKSVSKQIICNLTDQSTKPLSDLIWIDFMQLYFCQYRKNISCRIRPTNDIYQESH